MCNVDCRAVQLAFVTMCVKAYIAYCASWCFTVGDVFCVATNIALVLTVGLSVS